MTAISLNKPSVLQAFRNVWGEFAAFVRSPKLLQPGGLRSSGAIIVFAAMALLHMVVMTLLVPVLSAWQVQGGTGAPTAFAKVPQEFLIPLTVLAAPLFEETIFRGWLTGRPRALWLLGLGAISGLPLLLVKDQPLLTGGLMLVAWIAMLTGWIILRRRPDAPSWFQRHFGLVFYGMVLAFGLMHVSNYESPGLMTIPMVLPQLWCGLAFGFVRMRIGLPAAILMHALSNATVLSIALAGG